MRIGVTGSAGFVGRHVVGAARVAGHTVYEYDRANDPAVELYGIAPSNLATLDAVIHCAAYADISRNWESHDERARLYADNIDATISLLEAMPPDARLVFASTAAVLAGPLSPYVASKVAGEALVAAYAHRRGTVWPVVRLASCVGSGYHHGHIADFVRAARATGRITPLSSGRRANPFVHVRDAAEALVRAAEAIAPAPVTHVAADVWSWRDTVALMRMAGMPCEVAPCEREAGWIGDPIGLDIPRDYATRYAVADGVREAIEGLR